jgi:CubicO group peptidase (beta-lactamase class C family)
MKKIISVGLLVVVLSGIPIMAQDTAADWPTTGWNVSTPEEQGMSSSELAAYYTTWSQEQFNLDSLLVIRHGNIVAEAYGPISDENMTHQMYSATKSVIGALVGILIQDGLLESVDVPIVDLFPDRTIANLDERKAAITVADMLAMAPGLESNDLTAALLEQPATSALMEQTDDWVQFALDLPMVADPGTQWNYSNIAPMILSGLVTELTGKPAAEYAEEKLFAPLGISNYRWWINADGLNTGAAGLYLTPRDMAKIGYLFLRNGEWDGQQIIPADYAQAAIGNQINTPWDGTNYGYYWWRIEDINFSFALGFGGQYIMVMPDKDLIVVANGVMIEDVRVPLNGYPMFFASAFLTTAEQALAADEAGLAALQTAIDQISNPAAQPVPDQPALATEISDKPYFLINTRLFVPGRFIGRMTDILGTTSSLEVLSVSFTFDESDQALFNIVFTDQQTMAIPVGLDHLYRISEGRLGVIGARGEWLGDDLFRIYLRSAHEGLVYRIDFTFMPQAASIVTLDYGSSEVRATAAYSPPQQ